MILSAFCIITILPITDSLYIDYFFRCRFDFDLVDNSGAIPASIFGELAEKLLTFSSLKAMQHFNEILFCPITLVHGPLMNLLILFPPSCSQNVELPLDLVHEQLKSKIFLVHIKPVQAQLADARQRYTVIYYYETGDGSNSTEITNEPKNDLTLLNDQSPALQLIDPGK